MLPGDAGILGPVGVPTPVVAPSLRTANKRVELYYKGQHGCMHVEIKEESRIPLKRYIYTGPSLSLDSLFFCSIFKVR